MKWLSLIFLYVFIVRYCETFEYIVVPTIGGDDDGCIDELEECHHLSYYTSQSDVYFTSDTTLTFLPGTHILDHDGPVVISDVSNLTLQGDGEIQDGFHWTVKQSTVVIDCNGTNSGFLFRNFDDVTLSGLTITNCGYVLSDNIIIYVTQHYDFEVFIFVPASSFFSVLMFNGTNSLIESTSIQDGIGYGLTTVNVYGIDIDKSSFIGNNAKCGKHLAYPPGGNLRIVYTNTTHCPAGTSGNQINYVSVKNVSILDGMNCGLFEIENLSSVLLLHRVSGGGLVFLSYNYKCGKLQYIIDTADLMGSKGLLSSNLMFLGFPVPTLIKNVNCSLGEGQIVGGGVTTVISSSNPVGYSSDFVLMNSTFVGNDRRELYAGSGTAFMMVIFAHISYQQITLDSCDFLYNKGVSTVRIEQNNDISIARIPDVHFNNVHFRDNGEFTLRGTYDFTGALLIINNNKVYASNVSVINTQCPGIQLIGSSLTVSGNILLQNNSYKSGGGLILRAKSFLILKPPTSISFIDNFAEDYGAAIYIPSDDSDIFITACFYQIDDPSFSPNPDIVIRAVNNIANGTGNFLSGGNLGVCYLVHPMFNFFLTNTYKYFLSLIEPQTILNDNRSIVSDSVGVVYCSDNSFKISNRNIKTSITIYQGQLFNISIATICPVGSIFPGRMNIKLFNCTNNDVDCFDHDDAQIMKEWEVKTGYDCIDVPIVIEGDRYTHDLVLELSTDVRVPYDLLPPLHIPLHSADCPPGFKKEDVCVCNEFIESLEGVTCDINTTTITTTGNRVWIGYDNTTNATVYTRYCPRGFCIDGNVTFNILDSPDRQCVHHRSGISCGGCADGYSLLLGSNECGKCPNNNYLSLLLVFGVAGIALVVLLILLNLTVSVGTINGLVFYANIVKINENEFFRPDIPELEIFKPFISFINLDFGFKVCFYDGLTASAKLWLQFLFPLYIWAIIGLIMLLCRYSTRLSKLLGNNTVKVLATLFLLSYTKIVFIVGHVFSGFIVYYDYNSVVVWSSDSNLRLAGTEHIIGIVVFVLILTFLILPYSTLLVILPCIDRMFFPSIRRFFLRLKPFTDAYAGPFKDSHQYWLGLLLIFRVILIISINAMHLVTQYLTVFFLVLLLTLGYSLHGPYKENHLNILECWFLANLLLLIVFSLSDKMEIVVVGGAICLSLALLTFMCIIVYHIGLQLIKHGILKKCNNTVKNEKQHTVDDHALATIQEKGTEEEEADEPEEDSFDDSLSPNSFQKIKMINSRVDFSRFRDSIFNNLSETS